MRAASGDQVGAPACISAGVRIFRLLPSGLQTHMRSFAANAIDLLSGDHDGRSSPGLSSLSVKGRRSDPSGFIKKIFLFPPSPKLPRTNAIRPVGWTCSAYSDRVAKHANAPTLIESSSRRFNGLACMVHLPCVCACGRTICIHLAAGEMPVLSAHLIAA